ncbi:general secretion pathway protein L [Sphingomonas changbaiensis NBRC 104936]|uniref:General secretion pathway protein L n=1 Tax=Sphingomonas changbaiensis NBRC 104936 TaxID=1219043 RepID=A0A0E9MLK3_9SPHN|nr:type II secretion system protein GspL [Sphingomonas changbaiensis]GAO38677.1 general secretion pathway protein L [Sphingomonas changbaiensis NBRC 104936]
MSTLILFIAPDDRLHGWWIADGGEVVARGDAETVLPDILPAHVVAIAPAEAMTIHVAELGSLATAQARTAARLLVAETSVAPIETQHVAVGEADGGDRSVAVIGNGRIEAWLESLQAHGIDPDAILPAALLLPRPDSGFVRATIGAETVLRSRSAAFAEEAGLTELLVGDAPVEDVDPEPLVLAGLGAPELDLRQGAFAKRRRFQIDWPLVRRLAKLGGAVAAVTLLIAIVQIVRYGLGADRLDAEAQAVARTVVPDGGPDAVGALQARRAARQGAGLGFTATAGAVIAAVQAVPNVELSSLTFDADGLLRATVLAPGAAEAETLRSRIRAAGLDVEATPFTSQGGRIRGEFRIGRR